MQRKAGVILWAELPTSVGSVFGTSDCLHPDIFFCESALFLYTAPVKQAVHGHKVSQGEG